MNETQPDILWNHNLDDIKEITAADYEYAFCYSQENIIMYSRSYSAQIVDINKYNLNIFIENILINKECHFDYVIQDFKCDGIATIFYKNNYIYYTMYDDMFSYPFDLVKIKVDDVILDRLRNLY